MVGTSGSTDLLSSLRQRLEARRAVLGQASGNRAAGQQLEQQISEGEEDEELTGKLHGSYKRYHAVSCRQLQQTQLAGMCHMHVPYHMIWCGPESFATPDPGSGNLNTHTSGCTCTCQ
jgi:hypothetical protein